MAIDERGIHALTLMNKYADGLPVMQRTALRLQVSKVPAHYLVYLADFFDYIKRNW